MKTATKPSTILPRMTTTGKRRMRKLITFLRKLRPAEWNFAHIVSRFKENGTICGTVCCAIGWLPSIFPKMAKWEKQDGELYVSPKNSTDYNEFEMFYGTHVEVFQIPMGHADLFVPASQWGVHPSLPQCGSAATAKEVATMLEKYIKLTETKNHL